MELCYTNLEILGITGDLVEKKDFINVAMFSTTLP